MWADPKRRKYVLYGGAVGLAVLFVVYRRLKGSSSTAAAGTTLTASPTDTSATGTTASLGTSTGTTTSDSTLTPNDVATIGDIFSTILTGQLSATSGGGNGAGGAGSTVVTGDTPAPADVAIACIKELRAAAL